MAKSLDIIDPKREMSSQNDEQKPHDKEDEDRDDFPKERHSSGLFYLILGIVAVIVSAGFALYILFKDDKAQDKAAVPTATASPVVNQAAVGSSASASASSSVSPSSSASVAPVTGTFKYSNEEIRIANGNSVNGEATRIKTLLEGKGFKIASVGNATKQYDSSIVYYKTGQDKLAEALKESLSSEYKATIEKSDSIVGSYDAVIALGAKQ